MHDSPAVRLMERFTNLQGVINALGKRGRSGCNFRPERHAFDKLHHDEELPLVLADLVNCADIRMVQRGRRTRFLEESGAFGFE